MYGRQSNPFSILCIYWLAAPDDLDFEIGMVLSRADFTPQMSHVD